MNGLDILIAVKPGDTLSFDRMEKVNGVDVKKYKCIPHDSWWTAIDRRKHGESRHQTLEYIDDILQNPDNGSRPGIPGYYNSREFFIRLEKAVIGLRNLRETYKNDSDICAQILTREQKLEEFIRIHRDVDIQRKDLKPLPGLRLLMIIAPNTGSESGDFLDVSPEVRWKAGKKNVITRYRYDGDIDHEYR